MLDLVDFDADRGLRRLYELAHNGRSVTFEEVCSRRDELLSTVRTAHEASGIEFRGDWFRRLLFDQLGLSIDLPSEEIDLALWEETHSFTPAPNVAQTLAMLKEWGIALGIVSNAPFPASVMEHELRRHGLLDAFAFVMSSADYGLCKPHAALFATAAGRLGLAPEDVWFIGDKLHVDVAGAHAAGMAAIWYTGRRRELPVGQPCTMPDAEMDDWAQLPNLIEQSRRENHPTRTVGN